MKKKRYLRILAVFMAIILAVTGITPMPGMVKQVHASGIDNKTITGLGTGAITDPDPSNPGSWCYVYYGRAVLNNETHVLKYRVLQKDTMEFSKEDGNGNKTLPYKRTMFLDCDNLIKGLAFSNNNDKIWKNSEPYRWLNVSNEGFYNNSAYLTEAEKAAIAESYKKIGPAPSLGSGYVSLTGEKVFILDYSDVICPYYGYPSDPDSHNSRIKRYVGGTSQSKDSWWLKTGNMVYTSGYGAGVGDLDGSAGVCPAFNLDLSSVLFSSLVSGEEGSAGAAYKLTIKDNGLGITPGSADIQENTVTVPYQTSGSGVNRISVLLTDKEYEPGKAVSCGPNESGVPQVTYLKLNTSGSIANGTGTFQLPAEYAGLRCGDDYHAYLVAEKVFDSHETDYASEPVEFDIPDAAPDTCDHRFEYTVSGDQIIAYCGNDGCRFHESGIRVGMELPEDPVYKAGVAKVAHVTGYPRETVTNLAGTPLISYYISKGYGSTELMNNTTVTPIAPGEYVAVMTWGGQTVKKAFSIIDVASQGIEGANIKWYLSKDGVLTVTGNGAIRGYNKSDFTPWYDESNKITEIRISKGITGIGRHAFADLRKTTTIILPEGLKSIGEDAFEYDKPETIFIPKSVSYIGDGAFLCNTIKEIIVEEGNANYKVSGGVLFTQDGKTLVKYPAGAEDASYSMPDSVEEISYGAFAGASNLNAVDLPRGLKKIGDYAFSNSGILKLDIPDGIEYIGACAFEKSELLEIIIPCIESLDRYALYRTDKLVKIYFVGTEYFWNTFGLYIQGSPTVEFNYREDISVNYEMDEIAVQQYNGEPQTPEITLRNKLTGRTLFLNTDYSVQYSDNTHNGTAKAVATGRNGSEGSWSRYTGSVTGYFTISDNIKSANVTFRVVNGFWDDGTNSDKTVVLRVPVDDELKLTENSIPGVGNDPDSGYAAGSWDETPVKGAVIIGDKTYTYTYATKYAPCPFVDVTEDKFYYEAIMWAINQDPAVTTGKDDTHYAPKELCTRGQVVTFLWRISGCPEHSIENPFSDVKEGKYYYDAVLWAFENGITTGKGEGTFVPSGECSRGEFITFLWRMSGAPDMTGEEHPFEDVKEGKYYTNAVKWAYKYNVTTGTDDTHFSPGKKVNRGQAITFVYRYCQK